MLEFCGKNIGRRHLSCFEFTDDRAFLVNFLPKILVSQTKFLSSLTNFCAEVLDDFLGYLNFYRRLLSLCHDWNVGGSSDCRLRLWDVVVLCDDFAVF